MVDFIRRRLQVFVSSTYSDLIAERQAAVEAILTAGHIPAGMELFTSGDESQMDVIKEWIDESDVYLLILGGSYGSTEPNSGKSYIQLEYEYALSKNKLLFSCVIKDTAIENRVKEHERKVIEAQEPQKLKEFRKLVLSKMCRFWEDTKDIKISIGETLAQFARREDLIGWVRPSSQVNMPALADEIARLSRENAELRRQIQGRLPDLHVEGLSFEEMKELLDKRGLFAFLRRLRDDWDFPWRHESRFDPKVDELVKLGLVKKGRGLIGDPPIQFTDSGRLLLNRFGTELLRQTADKSSG